MSRALVLAPEPIRPKMAGMGIRAAEIARHLSLADHPVTLLTPGDPGEAPADLTAAGVRIEAMEARPLAEIIPAHDFAVVSGHVANALFSEETSLPTVVDLYDPFLIENLTYAETLGWGPFENDHATLTRQLVRGDLFLVSSTMQRAFYAGFLLALGRLNPARHRDDPGLDRLLPIVPFGTPESPPETGGSRLRSRIDGIGEDDPILFFGGIYDWYDPDELLDVLPLLQAEVPSVRVVFVENPNPDTTPQGAFARARRRAESEGWLGRSVVFVPWFPYAERGAVYAEATAAVLTHRPGLETDLSLRTRGLDFLWGGLPIVSHRGGAMGELLGEHQAGLLVDPGDRAGLVGALVRILTDESLRHRLRGRGREVAAAYRWSRVLEPVLRFAEEPHVDSARAAFRPAHGPLQPPAGEPIPPSPAGPKRPLSERLTSRLERIFTK